MLRYKKYYYENNFTKYGAIRSAVSAYLRKYKRRLPADITYREFVRKVYLEHRDKPIRKLHKELEGIVIEEIEIPGQFTEYFWLYESFTEDYKADKQVIVDMRPQLGDEYYYKGTLAEFKAEYLSDFIHAVNQEYNRAVYVFFLFEEFLDKKGRRVLYCLLVEENIDDIVREGKYFDIKQYLESLDLSFDIEAAKRPAIPRVIEVPPVAPPPPPAEKIKEIEAEKERLKLEKEVIELRRKEREETAKLVREFIKKGFTPEQIMKLFGIKE